MRHCSLGAAGLDSQDQFLCPALVSEARLLPFLHMSAFTLVGARCLPWDGCGGLQPSLCVTFPLTATHQLPASLGSQLQLRGEHLSEWGPRRVDPFLLHPPRPSLAPPHTCSRQVADHLGGPPPQALTSAGNPLPWHALPRNSPQGVCSALQPGQVPLPIGSNSLQPCPENADLSAN